ncbi:ubiquinol-cytochrome c reductase cytochrome b subunit [Carbonactinospora thermoautotrophica]|uniref:Cytochrome bc1 complex cytochrome b subunit n=1 Tax=Carbonactinospora thermoautotrophica TaxID=1469144 RepID=A0A132NHD7_9ACTN|nr:cytochrome bc complex cytochrome b subunit [Carbonactinospora thermoautotrophica]KWX05749.1 ubiquinol-cytochrome c reductase cytochrome b subunit [Carbonactinospora thermoautotrophica]KWX09494.1 ubiquinol-cytochrome c reductase cytochrome b subunit [Carbonactinospora thermoautotrophica]
MNAKPRLAGPAEFLDERVSLASLTRHNLRKVFPDHWSFLLGEIALYSFVVLLLSGTFLTFFFKPSMAEVVYQGSYVPLRGIPVSEAYASTLDISFDVRAGLLMRQIHHWSALLFVTAISVHLLRIFFTGAFRKPRELNWLIGVVMLILAVLEGFAGYSLPDDLLSGMGLRIAAGIVLSIPIVGTYLHFMIFGGEFPGTEIIPRLYIAHVLLVPALLLALITVHLMLIVYQKHTQFPGPGRTDRNVVGLPLLPVYTAKAGGFFFVVFGVCALLGGMVQINPIWAYGPYNPVDATTDAQPDWYIGWLEGALRAMPGWEFTVFGWTFPMSAFIPAILLPGLMFTLLALYPFIEAWITGDHREHNVLDRPRNRPTRTAIGVAAITFFTVLIINGGNDVIAADFDLSLNQITWFTRIGLVVLPLIAFFVTRAACLGLQARDRERLLHGEETGVIKRLPSGEYVEVHTPLPAATRYALSNYEAPKPLELPSPVDENGVRRQVSHTERVRVRLNQWWYGRRVEPPSAEEQRQITRREG